MYDCMTYMPVNDDPSIEERLQFEVDSVSVAVSEEFLLLIESCV